MVLLYGFEESYILIGRRAVRKNPYSDRGFFPVFLIATFTAYNVLINEINVLLICLKTLCVEKKFCHVQLFCILINGTTIDVN